METQSLPDIFEGAREYKGDSDALELAQKTFNEEALYQEIASFASTWYQQTQRKPDILDLCSATGLCALKVANTVPTRSVTLVDVNRKALRKGEQYFEGICPVSANCTDAVTFDNGQAYDLILMNSAYHHIENNRKVAFLRNASNLLNSNGEILVGEHFLPSYSRCEEFRESVVAFYKELISDLKERGESKEAINVIRRSGLYCWKKEYEYKVSWNIFEDHCSKSGLTTTKTTHVWPEGCSNEGGFGSFVVCIESK